MIVELKTGVYSVSLEVVEDTSRRVIWVYTQNNCIVMDESVVEDAMWYNMPVNWILG